MLIATLALLVAAAAPVLVTEPSSDRLSLVLALGGLVGSAARALLTTSQPTFSRRSLADVLIGGAVGFLWPLYPLIDFPAGATMFQKAVIVGVIAYFAGDVLLNSFQRLTAGLAKLNDAVVPPTTKP